MQLPLLSGIRGPADLRAIPFERLDDLAAEIRHAICEQVKVSGGHFAPNLGVVELTIALHYVFDFGHDRLLFDVGHQCYPHKLLTGRLPLLSKLRQRGGMAGFPDPAESPFDLFMVGHAGTAISTAVGMAHGDDLSGEGFHSDARPQGRRVVSLIGDASIVNGVAMEGLNNAGTLKRQFLVVLNDNGMSIAQPQGAVAAYLDRLRVSQTYRRAKAAARDVVSHLPGGGVLEDIYHRLGEIAKDAVAEDAWFEKFGLLTVGPVDGHDLRSLVEMLIAVRDVDRPVVLHVHTIKGKGYEFSEEDACRFHSPGPLRMDGCRVEIRGGGRSFTSAFGELMGDMLDSDPSVVACTAAMPDGTGLAPLLERFPQRVWDTGICESHAMDMMAGLARTGRRPFFAVYSTFLQRAFDQAFQEVSLQGLAVRLCLDRAGLVGGDGAVHHGFCDISILRTLPGAVLLAAMDEPSLREALSFMQGYDDGLTAVRYPRDTVSERFLDQSCPPFVLGRARALVQHPRPDVAILAYGTCVIQAAEALEALDGAYAADLYDARFARPVDTALLRSLSERDIPILTVEDHGLEGGFGACVIDAMHTAGLDTRTVHRIGIPSDRFIGHASREQQLAEVGLDAAGIARTVRLMLDPDARSHADAGVRSTRPAPGRSVREPNGPARA